MVLHEDPDTSTPSAEMKQSQVESEKKQLETTAKAEAAGCSGGSPGGGEGLDGASPTTPQEAIPGAPQQSEPSARTQPDCSAEGVGETGVEEKELPQSEKAAQGDAAQQQQQQQPTEGMVSTLSWMYLDGINPIQHGPVVESVMLKLLRSGTAHKDMMAWSQGMKEWQPLGQVSSVAPLIIFQNPEARLRLTPDGSDRYCCTAHTDHFGGSASSVQVSTGGLPAPAGSSRSAHASAVVIYRVWSCCLVVPGFVSALHSDLVRPV